MNCLGEAPRWVAVIMVISEKFVEFEGRFGMCFIYNDFFRSLKMIISIYTRIQLYDRYAEILTALLSC